MNQPNIPEATPHLPMVIGLGRAGIRIVSEFAINCHPEALRILLLDTDESTLKESPLPDGCKFLADFNWRGGMGCGGEFENGVTSIARERNRLTDIISKSSYVVVVSGLGGGCGSGGVTILSSIGRHLSLPMIFLLSLPFSFEGHRRRKICDNTLLELSQVADTLIPVPNDLLFSSGNSDFTAEAAFNSANREFAAALDGLLQLMKPENLLSGDFAIIKNMLSRKKSRCSLASSEITIDELASDPVVLGQELLERLFSAPLLGGSSEFKQANVVFFSISGGKELSLGVVRQFFDLAAKYVSNDAEVLTGIKNDSAMAGRIRLVALTVRFAPEVILGEKNLKELNSGAGRMKPRTPEPPQFVEETAEAMLPLGEVKSPIPVQSILPLETISRGIFENTTQFTYNGVNIDIPTYLRQRIDIDKGQ